MSNFKPNRIAARPDVLARERVRDHVFGNNELRARAGSQSFKIDARLLSSSPDLRGGRYARPVFNRVQRLFSAAPRVLDGSPRRPGAIGHIISGIGELLKGINSDIASLGMALLGGMTFLPMGDAGVEDSGTGPQTFAPRLPANTVMTEKTIDGGKYRYQKRTLKGKVTVDFQLDGDLVAFYNMSGPFAGAIKDAMEEILRGLDLNKIRYIHYAAKKGRPFFRSIVKELKRARPSNDKQEEELYTRDLEAFIQDVTGREIVRDTCALPGFLSYNKDGTLNVPGSHIHLSIQLRRMPGLPHEEFMERMQAASSLADTADAVEACAGEIDFRERGKPWLDDSELAGIIREPMRFRFERLAPGTLPQLVSVKYNVLLQILAHKLRVILGRDFEPVASSDAGQIANILRLNYDRYVMSHDDPRLEKMNDIYDRARLANIKALEPIVTNVRRIADKYPGILSKLMTLFARQPRQAQVSLTEAGVTLLKGAEENGRALDLAAYFPEPLNALAFFVTLSNGLLELLWWDILHVKNEDIGVLLKLFNRRWPEFQSDSHDQQRIPSLLHRVIAGGKELWEYLLTEGTAPAGEHDIEGEVERFDLATLGWQIGKKMPAHFPRLLRRFEGLVSPEKWGELGRYSTFLQGDDQLGIWFFKDMQPLDGLYSWVKSRLFLMRVEEFLSAMPLSGERPFEVKEQYLPRPLHSWAGLILRLDDEFSIGFGPGKYESKSGLCFKLYSGSEVVARVGFMILPERVLITHLQGGRTYSVRPDEQREKNLISRRFYQISGGLSFLEWLAAVSATAAADLSEVTGRELALMAPELIKSLYPHHAPVQFVTEAEARAFLAEPFAELSRFGTLAVGGKSISSKDKVRLRDIEKTFKKTSKGAIGLYSNIARLLGFERGGPWLDYEWPKNKSPERIGALMKLEPNVNVARMEGSIQAVAAAFRKLFSDAGAVEEL